MIRMALPNKGQLFEPTLELLRQCGYKANKPTKTLTCVDPKNGIEFYFLRPSDIPMYVGTGIIDLGITGIDFVAEANSPAEKILDLDFGHSRLCAAVPNESPYQTLADIADLRIATSFRGIVEQYYQRKDLKIVDLEGAVEISVSLGVSDAIVDVVETGTTLKQAGLRIIGEALFHSNAALYAHPGRQNQPELLKLKKRIEGRLVASSYMMVEYDAPESILDQACQLTPGIASPTVTRLHAEGWFSVKSMIPKKDAHQIMDTLAEMGAKGIVLTTLESARIG
jgi:ATP phosphoribosyltransferase